MTRTDSDLLSPEFFLLRDMGKLDISCVEPNLESGGICIGTEYGTFFTADEDLADLV